MKTLKYVAIIILIMIVFPLFFVVVNIPKEVLNKTVSVEKAINNYETFIEDYNAFQQYKSQYCVTQNEMEKTAARQMMYNIARRYNAMSDTFYKELVKKGDYPRKLDVRLNCE